MRYQIRSEILSEQLTIKIITIVLVEEVILLESFDKSNQYGDLEEHSFFQFPVIIKAQRSGLLQMLNSQANYIIKVCGSELNTKSARSCP